MTDERFELAWPSERLGEALSALARLSRLRSRPGGVTNPPPAIVGDPGSLDRWLEASALGLGLEAEPVEAPFPDVLRLVTDSAPSLCSVRRGGALRFLAVLGRRRGKVVLLGPDLRRHRVPSVAIRDLLCGAVRGPMQGEVEALLAAAGVPAGRRERARDRIIAQRSRGYRVGGCWLLRYPPGRRFLGQLAEARVPQRLGLVLAGHGAQYALLIGSWWVLGRGALSGRLDWSLLWLWALLLLAMVPLRLLSRWAAGMAGIHAGGLLKRRLLSGALALTPDETRKEGAGRLLGRVLESEAVEAMAVTGGLLALVSALELLLAGLVLGQGAGGAVSALALLAWCALTAYLTLRLFRRRTRWADTRLDLTHDLVEKMVGHRTRLAQLERERWHDDEDQGLHHYHSASRRVDASSALLIALVARGWLVVGLASLAPAFVTGSASVARLAVGIGGVLLAFQSFSSLVPSLGQVVNFFIAWRQVAPLFAAAARPETVPHPELASLPLRDRDRSPGARLEARGLAFTYPGRAAPVWRDLSLEVEPGARIFLEGDSGGGKSTLGNVLAGLRAPDSGLLLVDGLDRDTLGPQGWRYRVVTAPQFHDNHVLSETMGFNLLMGRGWPPRAPDLGEAAQVCRELGLDEVLARMPSGMEQMLGDTGWQLSHGERSRLYIARTLLHDTEMIILDESFAALDPETLRQALECVERRARTLMVIAHP